MLILKAREGLNDGGFAVCSYTQTQSYLGRMEDFEELLDYLKSEEIFTCIDFVLNHTAKEHDLALKAIADEEKYQNIYFMYDCDKIPKKFEETLPEILPDLAPKNFTYYDNTKK